MIATRDQEIILEMALNKAVDRQLDFIVQAAVRVAKLLEGGSMRENQLRNVLDTALHTDSIELVANFIRYQIGRSVDWQNKKFGEQVIAALASEGAVGKAADAVTAEVLAIPDLSVPEDEVRRRTHILLARRFLGEMNRAFLYADRTRDWSKLQPVIAVQPPPDQAARDAAAADGESPPTAEPTTAEPPSAQEEDHGA